MGKYEIPISREKFLVSRILCGYCWKEYKKIQEYIKNQLKEDKEAEQLSLELKDPFSKK